MANSKSKQIRKRMSRQIRAKARRKRQKARLKAQRPGKR